MKFIVIMIRYFLTVASDINKTNRELVLKRMSVRVEKSSKEISRRRQVIM